MADGAGVIAAGPRLGQRRGGRVGAIAVIRTFLNYFLERDVELQRRDRNPQPTSPE